MTTAVLKKRKIVKLVNARGIGAGYQVVDEDGPIKSYFNGPFPPVDHRPPKPKVSGNPFDRIGGQITMGRTSLSQSLEGGSGEIIYGMLRRATYDDEECPHCGHYPNTQNRQMATTSDMGRQTLVKCGRDHCGKFFKPY